MKILIIRLSSLGDIVLAQPVCAALRAAFPHSEISFLIKEQYKDVVSAFAVCDKIIYYEKSLAFHWRLRRERFDFVVDLHGKFASKLISQICKADARYAYTKKHILRRLIVNRLSKKSIPPVSELYFQSLSKQLEGCEDKEAGYRIPRIYPQVELPEIFQQIQAGARKKFLIALFPGAAHQTKMYPISSWIKLIKQCPEQYEFVLLGSPGEKYLTKPIMDEVGERCHNLCGLYSLGEIISIVDSCHYLLSNDSGPMHIGAALAKPQIAIFGATHPRLGFSPQNEMAVVLAADLSCQPCSLHGGNRCPRGHFNCMKMIEPEELCRIIRKTLER